MRPNSRRVVPATKPGVSVRGTASSTASVMHRKAERGGGHKEETVEERKFPPGVEPATVSVGVGMTINTGNFESLRIDVRVSLPCMPEEVESTYERASEHAADFLNAEQARWLSEQQRTR